MKTPTERFKGATALLGAAFIYATFGVLIREMSKMFGDNSQVAVRFSLAFIFVILLNAARHNNQKLSKSILAKVLALSLTFTSLVILFTLSVNNTKIANSVFLLYAGSIITSLFIGTLYFKEKLHNIKILSIGLALVGLAMYSNALLAINVGVIAGVAAGILDGVSNSIRKKLKGVNRNIVLQYQYGFGGAFAIVITLISGEQAVRTVGLVPILATVLFALLFIGIGNFLLYGFQHFDVNVGTVILASELLFATILGLLLFAETPTAREISGGLLIFAASALSTIEPSKHRLGKTTAKK